MSSITIADVVKELERFAPKAYQESFDNCGLQVGEPYVELKGILIALDITEAVIDEAINTGCNLIVAHHPLLFRPLKNITGRTYIERCVIKALQQGIAIYAGHTNVDSVPGGVSFKMADKLGLINAHVMVPKESALSKLVVYVPKESAEVVQQALFEKGAGRIGNYDCCSYQLQGEGCFRPLHGSHPYSGKEGEHYKSIETRIEVIVPNYLVDSCVAKMKEVHPYEEPAFDIIELGNKLSDVGLGVIAELPKAMTEKAFLKLIKTTFHADAIQYSALLGKEVRRVALCGGSGADFIEDAKAKGADVYVTGEIGYHHFFDADNSIVLVEIGHYESEQFTKEIFYEQLIEKFSNFAIRMSQSDTNPVYVM